MAWTGKKSNVVFSKPAEPAFLKKFKEKVGYKESSGINEKFQSMPAASKDDIKDKDDEVPQVVQLKPGDLSLEEYENLMKNTEPTAKEIDDSGLTDDGRIKFRKLAKEKRESEVICEFNKSTKKQKITVEQLSSSNVDEKSLKNKEKKDKDLKRITGVNKKLLSFNEDDDDEDS